jgi:pullulanase
MGVRSTLSRPWPRCRLSLAALMLSSLAGTPIARAADAPLFPAGGTSIAACDAGPATLLAPQSPTLGTQASGLTPQQPVWLDARRLRWPGLALAAGEVVRWHHSASGGLSVSDGRVSGSDRSVALRIVDVAAEPLSAALATQSAYLGAGVEFALEEGVDPAALQRGQALIVVEDAQGRVRRWSVAQTARALDAIYASAEDEPALGVTVTTQGAAFKLWAPTADRVELCAYDGPDSAARARLPLTRDDRTGIWAVDTARRSGGGGAGGAGVRSGSYYRYLVELFVPGVGRVRNLVTDPYSVSLSADSSRSYVADLSEPRLQPRG